MEENSPWSPFENDWSTYGTSYDAMYNGGVLHQALNPGEAQYREFSQQMVAQMYQNWYNSPAEDMKRKIAVGVNPYAAAAGIAGSPSSGDAPSVPSSAVGEGNRTLNTLADAAVNTANAITGGVASLGDGIPKLAKLAPELELLDKEIESKLLGNGLTSEQIYAWKVDNKYRDENSQADLRLKGLQAENYSQQWKLMEGQYQLVTQQIDTELEKLRLMQAEGSNLVASKEYYEKLKEKTDYEAQFAKARIDFWKERGFDILASSTDAILVQMIENGKSISNIVQEMSNYYQQVGYARAKAENEAEAEYAGRIASARENAKSIASIITDWNVPSSSIWKSIIMAFSSNKSKIDNPREALTNPEAYNQFMEFQNALWLNISQLESEIRGAMSRNELVKVSELSKKREAQIKFARDVTFSEWCNRMYSE